MQLGSIEAGGTKFVCAVGDENYRVKDKVRIPTTTPEETLSKTVAYFKQFPELKALAISSFGPIELRHNSPKYGYITDTPKKGWANTDFVGRLKQDLDIPMYWTTDVNGSAYGEYVMSTLFNEQINSLVYFTIGTGVGAGTIINGKFVIPTTWTFRESVRSTGIAWKAWSAVQRLKLEPGNPARTCR